MGRRIVFDIEGNNLFPAITEIHCIVAKDIDTDEVFTFGYTDDTQFKLSQFKQLLRKCDMIIGHNIITFDLPAMHKLLGIEFSIADTCNEEELEKYPHWTISDKIDGIDCFVYDTLVMSKTLNPDRPRHGLEWWGKKLGNHKGDFAKGNPEDGEEDPQKVWEKFTPEMLTYCIQDVDLNHEVYDVLEKERGSWDWDTAFWIEKATADVICRQEHFGIFFDQELARENLEELNHKLDRIEKKVEPKLPRKLLPKSKRPNFPAKPFTDDGRISAHGYNWLARLGYEINEEAKEEKVIKYPAKPFKTNGDISATGEKWLLAVGFTDVRTEEKKQYLRDNNGKVVEPEIIAADLYEKACQDLRDKVMPDMTTPMKLSDQEDIKRLLIREFAWVPLNWKDKDLTCDSKKNKLTPEKFEAAVDRYFESTFGEEQHDEYAPYRLEHLKVKTKEEFRSKLMQHNLSRPLKVLTQPIYTEGNDKDKLCKNLERIGKQVNFVRDVVHWLTYRHRRNAILSPNGTGFLAHPRLEVDGRLPTPADTCGCSTSRFQHKIVANIPRTTSLYGEPMRKMFCVPEGKVQIGCDADGLEARIEGHYCYEYTGGEQYAISLVAPKPNDLHTVNAKKMDVPRDDAKTLKYASSYGAQPPKIAKQMGWALKRAKQVFDAFWLASLPLKELKERLEQHWKMNNKKWILGIDGRKLVTRAQHALLNTLFQSAGVICMKRAMIYWDRWIRDEGLEARQLIAYHDEAQMEDDMANCKFKVFPIPNEIKDMEDGDSKKDAIKAFKATVEDAKTKMEEETGLIWSDVGKSDRGFYFGYNKAGELAAESINAGGKFFKLDVELTGGYQLGRNWADCH